MGSICHFPCALPASIWGHCSRILVFASVWGAQKGVWQWHFSCCFSQHLGILGAPNTAKQGKTQNDKSALFYPFTPPPSPPIPTNPTRPSHPESLISVHFGSVSVRFGSVSGLFRVHLGGVGVGSGRGASVREKRISLRCRASLYLDTIGPRIITLHHVIFQN